MKKLNTLFILCSALLLLVLLPGCNKNVDIATIRPNINGQAIGGGGTLKDILLAQRRVFIAATTMAAKNRGKGTFCSSVGCTGKSCDILDAMSSDEKQERETQVLTKNAEYLSALLRAKILIADAELIYDDSTHEVLFTAPPGGLTPSQRFVGAAMMSDGTIYFHATRGLAGYLMGHEISHAADLNLGGEKVRDQIGACYETFARRTFGAALTKDETFNRDGFISSELVPYPSAQYLTGAIDDLGRPHLVGTYKTAVSSPNISAFLIRTDDLGRAVTPDGFGLFRTASWATSIAPSLVCFTPFETGCVRTQIRDFPAGNQSIEDFSAVTLKTDGGEITSGTVTFSTTSSRGYVRMTNAVGGPVETFGLLGKVMLNYGSGRSTAVGHVVKDGKITIVGNFSLYPSYAYRRLAMSRLNADGTPDLTFGGDGTSVLVTPSKFFAPTKPVLDKDSRLVIGGTGRDTAWRLQVVRVTVNGDLDYEFADNGVATLPLVGDGAATSKRHEMHGVQVLPNGKILAWGRYFVGTEAGLFVARLTSNGDLDNSFAEAGILKIRINNLPEVGRVGLGLQIDKTILLSATVLDSRGKRVFGVLRASENGTWDRLLSGDGILLVDDTSAESMVLNDLLVYPEGKLLLLGSSRRSDGTDDASAIRLNNSSDVAEQWAYSFLQ